VKRKKENGQKGAFTHPRWRKSIFETGMRRANLSPETTKILEKRGREINNTRKNTPAKNNTKKA